MCCNVEMELQRTIASIIHTCAFKIHTVWSSQHHAYMSLKKDRLVHVITFLFMDLNIKAVLNVHSCLMIDKSWFAMCKATHSRCEMQCYVSFFEQKELYLLLAAEMSFEPFQQSHTHSDSWLGVWATFHVSDLGTRNQIAACQ